MDKSKIWWVVGIVGAIILISLWVLLFMTQDQPSANQQDTTNSTIQTAQPTTQPDQAITPVQAGTYQNYSAETLATSKAKTNLIFFYAPWCPQCRALEKSIEQSGVPENIAIFKVDYDTATELKKKYGVTIQTTIVQVNPDGSLIKKHVAYDNPALTSVLNALGIE
ncbi:MAG TPA: thioredoxin domain-containing protein [Candidatus Saccharimonadales bacterium]|nr:thioredoxin domain-containing protein [Candidatus Saccharimonadales bacterium]